MSLTYTYGQDILIDVLERASEYTELTGANVSDYLTSIKRFINQAYIDFLGLYPWPFALKDPPGVIATDAVVSGTATFTKGSAIVTATATISPSMTDRKIYAESDGVPYRISSHTDGSTIITLDSPFTSTTTSATFYIYQDEYTLASDCLKPWWMWFRDNPQDVIHFDSLHYLQATYATPHQTSLGPVKVAYIKNNKIRFSSYSTDSKTIEYDYTYDPGDLDFSGSGSVDTPIIPLRYRHFIADIALSKLQTLKNESPDMNYVGELRELKKFFGSLRQNRFRPRKNQSLGVR